MYVSYFIGWRATTRCDPTQLVLLLLLLLLLLLTGAAIINNPITSISTLVIFIITTSLIELKYDGYTTVFLFPSLLSFPPSLLYSPFFSAHPNQSRHIESGSVRLSSFKKDVFSLHSCKGLTGCGNWWVSL